MNEEEISKKVNLEIDLVGNIRHTNRFQWWIDLAEAVDAWRLWPRAFLTIYMVLLYRSCYWFMGLDSPNAEQSALISVIVGAGAVWFNSYLGGKKPAKE